MYNNKKDRNKRNTLRKLKFKKNGGSRTVQQNRRREMNVKTKRYKLLFYSQEN